MDNKTTPVVATVFLSLLVGSTLYSLAQNPSPQIVPSGYHLLKTIPVGGTEGWDYVTMDSDGRRLYIGRDDHIDIVDVDAGTIAGKVTGLSHVHGMVLAPDLGRGFTSDGEANTSTILDLEDPEEDWHGEDRQGP